MNVINTNIRAQFAQAALSMIERRQSVAMERLSTGKRINSARDDAAGLAIAARMSELIRGTHQAIQNANNGIGMIQTAEGAAGQIGDRLQRMRELAVQASNGTYTDAQRGAMDMEYQQLKQDIVSVTKSTRWNGVSLLTAEMGSPVASQALYKTVSAGQWVQQYGGQVAYTGQLFDTNTAPSTRTDKSMSVTDAVNFSHKGKLVIDFAGGISAKFVTLDGSVTTLGVDPSSVPAAGSIKLLRHTGLMSGDLSLQTADHSALGTAQRLEITIDSSADLGVIQRQDLNLNGVDIDINPADVLDTVSLPGNAAASAITKAAQINRFSEKTGVTAVVNRNLMGGRAMSSPAAMTGILNINGYLTTQITTSATDSTLTRQQVIDAINALTARTGVKAIDSRLSDGGVTLVAEDGRNIDVEMFSNDNIKFSALVGLNSGVQVGTYSLAVHDGKGLKVSSALEGDLQHSGLMMGNYTSANITSVVTSERAVVTHMKDVQSLHAGDLLINGVAVPAAQASDDSVSDLSTDTSSRAASGIALAAAVNSISDKTGVTALVQPVLINGTQTTSTFNGTTVLMVNGRSMSFTMSSSESAEVKKTRLIREFNQSLSAQTGVDAVDNGSKGISLKARDGRNVSVWYETDSVLNPSTIGLKASEFGLGYLPEGQTDPVDVPGISSGYHDESRLGATFYAGVVLQASRDISIKAGPQSVVDGRISNFTPAAYIPPAGDYVMTNAAGAETTVRVMSTPVTTHNVPTPYLLDPGQHFSVNDELTALADPFFRATVNSVADSYSRFNALGFTESESRVISTVKAEHYQPPAVGRLDFQVGSKRGDTISIDIPDFGAQGSITQLVTWDVNHTYPFVDPAVTPEPGVNIVSTYFGLGRTTLGQDIDAAATTIPVRSTQGFPPSGTVYVDNELISYTGLTASSLTGVTRGAMNTTASNHRGDAVVRKSSDALLSNLYSADPMAPPLQVGLTIAPPPSHVLTQKSASDVLLSLDAALYKVNQARSNMGAVMNRLEYSVSNLYDTYTNMSASRSKIEDADYAAESSDMARAQIIQQAATAILAQANTNQQTVLKLLQ